MKKVNKNQTDNKIVVILGPTASGKSALAVELARKFGGEVVSADSRQVYRGLDVGTGKITKREMRGVPHHLLDVASPKSRKKFTVADYQKLAGKAVDDILARGKLPIICGGTGFYIQALVDDIALPDVPPNAALRKKLAKKSPVALIKILRKLDPVRAKNIDPKNPHRLIRAIEIATTLGKVPPLKKSGSKNQPPAKYAPLFIGLKIEPKELREKIAVRLKKRLGDTRGEGRKTRNKNMIQEARDLHAAGLSWKRMRELGLEYRFLADFLTSKISREQMVRELETAIWQYSRRQMSWFGRDGRIEWIQPKDMTKIEKLARKFLKKINL